MKDVIFGKLTHQEAALLLRAFDYEIDADGYIISPSGKKIPSDEYPSVFLKIDSAALIPGSLKIMDGTPTAISKFIRERLENAENVELEDEHVGVARLGGGRRKANPKKVIKMMDDNELIRTICACADKGRVGLPAAYQRCLNILKERDLQRDKERDEELVEGLARYLRSLDSGGQAGTNLWDELEEWDKKNRETAEKNIEKRIKELEK